MEIEKVWTRLLYIHVSCLPDYIQDESQPLRCINVTSLRVCKCYWAFHYYFDKKPCWLPS